MNAIQLPVYDNTDLSNCDVWFLRNLRPAMNYIQSLGVSEYEEIMELVTIQYERQLINQQVNK